MELFALKTPRNRRTSVAALLLSMFALCANPAPAQSDNFDDGNDNGWTRYDRNGTATFSFPNGAYRIQGTSLPTGETGKALVLSCLNQDYTNFYAAVDLVSWDHTDDANVRPAIGLAVRATDIGAGTTKSVVLYYTPALAGGGLRVFAFWYLHNDVPEQFGAIALTTLTVDPTHSYRMVATGVGNNLEGRIYDLNDLTKPVGQVFGTLDPSSPAMGDLPASGKCGVFAYSRNNTNLDVTFDNFVVTAADPATVPAPATPHSIPGAPQVVNRLPRSLQNFYPPAGGISFNATTLGGNAIDPSGIKLLLNNVDVSSSLLISGAANNRTVTYNGLASNKVYQGRITLTETGGKSSTNDFAFDTFSEAYLTNTARVVEAEDYNFLNQNNSLDGWYLNDPLPSGYDTNGMPVNQGDFAYLDQQGTLNVDLFDTRISADPDYNKYRFFDTAGTFPGALYYAYVEPFSPWNAVYIYTNDTIRQKFSALGLPEYQVQRTEGTEWLNYTRDFAPGKYNVYLRLSSLAAADVLFDEVTSDRTQPNQTTSPVGKFHVAYTGQPSRYRYFPLVDDVGNLKLLNWTGQKTFRLTMDGPVQDYTKNTLQINYLVFVPAPPAAVTLTNPGRVGNVFSVSFTSESGVTYTLQYKNSLSDAQWTDTTSSVVGNGGLSSLSDTSTQPYRFYRVAAQ